MSMGCNRGVGASGVLVWHSERREAVYMIKCVLFACRVCMGVWGQDCQLAGAAAVVASGAATCSRERSSSFGPSA